MGERAGIQRGPAIASALAGWTVARLTELVVQRLPVGCRGSVPGKWIRLWLPASRRQQRWDKG